MATIWETRFNNHSLWTVADQIRGSLADVETPSSVDGAESLARLIWLLELLQAHRETEDVRGYTPTMLENVQRMLTGNVQNQVNQYLADPEAYEAHLQTAAQQIDTVLDQMGAWPPLPARGAAIAAGQTYSKYEAATKAALESLASDRDGLSADLQSLRHVITEQTDALEAVRRKFQSDAEEAIQGRLEDLSVKYLAEVQGSIDSINADKDLAAEKRDLMEKMEAEGKNVLEAVANRAIAKNYRRNAFNKSLGGWLWDFAGLVVGGAPLVLLLVHFFRVDPGTQTTTSLTLTRLGISIAAVGLAALCFHRGSTNHKESCRAKRADIRLTTVHPFIANQDEDFQNAMVEGMAERIYLQGILDDGESTHDPSLLQEALERVRARRQEEEPTA